ncbi:MAG: YeeE/YedE family protein [Bacteroidetes bacterium]|jgi:rhodanese-related sulfurtransferase|nr:YeeE/YedE family protein [Bacteroidota bacterium]
MGPLVPDIIGSEFNLVIALLVGIGFGFALEQAGFSSTKKLVGLFYGYDFTVLKVFFTAGVTAMTGVLLFSHLGWLDLGLIYINPTFLWSALVGGGIMGAGFIIGGFCPGTSVCAAAVGKVDGMMFILGSILGIFAFTEGYPAFEQLYMAENWGALTAYDFLGISKELFGFYVAAVAIMAFFFTTLIENRINGRTTTFPKPVVRRNVIAGGLVFVLLALVAFTPSDKELIQKRIAEERRQQKCVFKEMPADKLAYELIHNYWEINLIDVRDTASYSAYHLPLAINIPLDSMMNREWKSYFTQTHKKNIFYADTDTTAKKACLLAKHLGKSDNYILRESTSEFRAMFFDLSVPEGHVTKQEQNIYRFRHEAAMQLTNLVKSLQHLNKPVKKEVRKIQGGCS